MEWNWNGNNMGLLRKKVHEKQRGNGMEIERQWNGIKMDNPSGSKICWIGMKTGNWNGEVG